MNMKLFVATVKINQVRSVSKTCELRNFTPACAYTQSGETHGNAKKVPVFVWPAQVLSAGRRMYRFCLSQFIRGNAIRQLPNAALRKCESNFYFLLQRYTSVRLNDLWPDCHQNLNFVFCSNRGGIGWKSYTTKVLSIGIERSEQTVQSQIGLLLEQSN